MENFLELFTSLGVELKTIILVFIVCGSIAVILYSYYLRWANNPLSQIYYIHDNVCNQKYGTRPYSYHLRAVVKNVEKYSYYFKTWLKNAKIAAAGHDLIEDARVSYNEVVELFGYEVANIIYDCTEEKGKDRSSRHGPKYVLGLKNNRRALGIKLCDILANVSHSHKTNSRMLEKYRKEIPKFKSLVYVTGEYEDIWNEIESYL
jgi:(p)ppGpp synthase/HD superfamily hydrolase